MGGKEQLQGEEEAAKIFFIQILNLRNNFEHNIIIILQMVLLIR
jgi:hypothetical protein